MSNAPSTSWLISPHIPVNLYNLITLKLSLKGLGHATLGINFV